LYFLKIRLDLNFYPTDKENYTVEELSSSSFWIKIFSNYGQTDSYPNQVQYTILNFNQDGYYSNYPYDSSIYPNPYSYVYSNNIIYQQLNLAVQPYHTYNFFDGSNNTYQELNFKDNYGN
jgi:hypothetical protein